MKRIIAILFALNLLCGLAACGGTDTPEESSGTQPETEVTSTALVDTSAPGEVPTKAPAAHLPLRDASKPLVYTLDESDPDWRVAVVNLDCDAAQEVNAKAAGYERGDPVRMALQYSFAVNGSVLSVVLHAEETSDYPWFDVFNIDLVTGRMLRDADVLRVANRTEKELTERLQAQQDMYYKGAAEEYVAHMDDPEEDPDGYKKQQWLFFNSMIGKDVRRPEEGNRLFFNSKNHLCSLLVLVPHGGPDSITVVFDSELPADAYYENLADGIG